MRFLARSSCVIRCLLLACLAGSASAASADTQVLDPDKLKSFHDQSGAHQRLQVTTDPEALKLVERIFAVYGLRIDPEVYQVYVTNGGRGETATAQALYKNGLRYIVFNKAYMERLRQDNTSDWPLISIAAHEVAHHMRLHVEGPRVNRKLAELEADYYAGFTLGKLHAPHDETTSAIRALPDNLGVDYPPRAKRVAEISRGWDDATGGREANPPTQVGPAIDPKKLTDRFKLRNNRDIYGNDIAIIAGRPGIAGVNMESCAAICDAIPACVGFSFDRWKSWCYLKGAIKASTLEPSSTIAVKQKLEIPKVEQVSTAIERLPNKAFRDEAYLTVVSADKDKCETACERDLRCVAFTFGRQTKACRMFKYSEGFFADEGADSGFKRQPPPAR